MKAHDYAIGPGRSSKQAGVERRQRRPLPTQHRPSDHREQGYPRHICSCSQSAAPFCEIWAEENRGRATHHNAGADQAGASKLYG
jgi:hypothetical protein